MKAIEPALQPIAPASFSEGEMLIPSLNRVEKWVEEHHYKGYEPFDGLSSWFRPFVFGNLLGERILQQVVRQSPLNVRPLFGINVQESSKGRGYMAAGYLLRYRTTGKRDYLSKAEMCLDWLDKNKAPKFADHSWSNCFDFSSRGGKYTKDDPIIVWTGIIGHAYLDAYEITKEPRWLSIADSAARWIFKLPREKTDTGNCLSYLFFEQESIHNANMLGAGLLARAAKFTGNAEYQKAAQSAMWYSVSRQRPDGSWWYAEPPMYQWIDNFHTGYNLDSLKHYIDSSGDESWKENLRRGLDYYKANFFEADGCPKYYHNRCHPIDSQCAGQAMETLAAFSDEDPTCLELGVRCAEWTIRNMQASDGHFYYRIYPWGTAKTAMLHWGQATIYKGLCMLTNKMAASESGLKMKVTVCGLGYVGCVTSACLAQIGHDVTGVDTDANKVALLNEGRSPLIEPGLEDLIKAGVKAGRLRASNTLEDLGDVCIICVGTPSNANGSLCLDYVRRVVSSIGDALKKSNGYHVINVRSTVVPGTVESEVIPLLAERSGKKASEDFGVCMNPEFLRETTAVKDFHAPPFTVVGGADKRSIDTVAKLYEGIDAPMERTSLRVAEMIKYSCNAFHALKVCFGNEIGLLCKSLDIDSHAVMEVFCKDTKLNLSPYYLKPGFAFGGSCLPKDLRAILHKAKQQDLELAMLGSLLESNRRHLEHAFDLVQRTGKKNIGILGLSFKAGTDDLRESPVALLVERLIGKGYKLSIYDEEVSLSQLIGANRRYIEATIPHISALMAKDVSEVFANNDVIVVTKKTQQFQEALARHGAGKTIIDVIRVPQKPGDSAKYDGICW